MTTANHFFSCLSLMPLVRLKDRPRLRLPNSRAEIPLATFSDLKETLSLVEYVDGIGPYVLEWFNTVFLAAHSEIVGENIKRAEALTEEEKEKKKKHDPSVGVTSKELAKWIKAHGSKGMATKYIRESYLEPLYNSDYLEKEENPDDKREIIYSPITDKQDKLFGENSVPVKDATVYPSQENLSAWIDNDIDDAAIVEPSDGTIALPTEEIVRKYYSDPSTCFKEPTEN